MNQWDRDAPCSRPWEATHAPSYDSPGLAGIGLRARVLGVDCTRIRQATGQLATVGNPRECYLTASSS
jgi:hypothetical protein